MSTPHTKAETSAHPYAVQFENNKYRLVGPGMDGFSWRSIGQQEKDGLERLESLVTLLNLAYYHGKRHGCPDSSGG